METRSKKRKRQRLMQSYILPQRPDLPAVFESLNDDTLTTVLEFVGNKCYKSFGEINKHCKEVYLTTKGMMKETFLFGYAPFSVIRDKIERGGRFNHNLYERVGKGVVLYNRRDVLDWALEERNMELLKGICNVAGEEGRLDILEEVLDYIVNDNERYVFQHVDLSAARGGKLNVLKWLEEQELYINNEEECANTAAEGGHLHILKWLREEQSLTLDEELYYEAIRGGQLHVIKWLREQEVDWQYFTFNHGALNGNLDILQWLHDEGCPWPDDDFHRVDEEDLKPEVIEWLRLNGYGDRFDD